MDTTKGNKTMSKEQTEIRQRIIRYMANNSYDDRKILCLGEDIIDHISKAMDVMPCHTSEVICVMLDEGILEDTEVEDEFWLYPGPKKNTKKNSLPISNFIE